MKKSTILIITGLLGSAIAAQASVISVNFQGGRDSANGPAVTGTAGYVAAGNWNNATGGVGGSSLSSLVDDSGSNTAVSISYTTWNVWDYQTGDGNGGDVDMMSGILDNMNVNGVGEISLSNISYDEYDVYVYFNRVAETYLGLTASDNDSNSETLYARNSGTPYSSSEGYIVSTDDNVSDGWTTANVVKFSGFTGSTFTIDDAADPGAPGTYKVVINGIQIVPSGYVVPPPAPIVWENDFSADPVGDGWTDRNSPSAYTVSDGLMVTTGSTLLDSDPFDQFMALTKVDLVWRATATTSNPDDLSALGAGLWLNVNGDSPDYGALNIHSVLLEDGTQTVKIYVGWQSQLIATIPGFGDGMLTMSAEINSELNTMAYMITDGTVTNSDAISYPLLATSGTTIGATLFDLSAGGGAEFDYVRVEANALPDETYFVVTDSSAMTKELTAPATTVIASADLLYGSAANLDMTVTISDESHPGTFSVLSDTPQTLPSVSGADFTLEFEFDNSVEQLEGVTATAQVTVAWSEAGSGVTNDLVLPLSVFTGFAPDEINTFDAAGDGEHWGDADNWSLGRVPGAMAADRGIIQHQGVVTVATNFTGATPYEVLVRNDSVLTVVADLKNIDDMNIGFNSSHNATVNQTAGDVTAALLYLGADTAAVDSYYYLSGGSLSVGSDVTVLPTGELDVNGGVLSMNDALFVQAGGVVTMSAGSMTVDSDNNNMNESMVNISAGGVLEVSGGTFHQLNGRVNNDGTLRIVGDDVTVTMKEYWADCTGTVEFILDETGVSRLYNSSWGHLNNTDFVIDGAAYEGPARLIELYRGGWNSHALGSDYVVSNLGVEGVDWEILEIPGSAVNDPHTVWLNILTSHVPEEYDLIVQPSSAVQTDGGAPHGSELVKAIDGTGLSSPLDDGYAVSETMPTHSGFYPNGTRWLDGQWPTAITFDLGGAQEYALKSVVLYNYQEWGDQLDRGIQSVDVYVSTDGSDFKLFQDDMTFAQATLIGSGGSAVTEAQTVDFAWVIPAGATHIRLSDFQTFGDTIMGFEEIRFVATQFAGPYPIGDISLGGVSGSDRVISWVTALGQTYNVMTNQNLVYPSWGIQETIVGDGYPVSVTNAAEEAQLFYKVTTP
jgi:hypothetical protein